MARELREKNFMKIISLAPTSFLTPPFGFSLFYLKSVYPKNVKTSDIYLGVIPYVIIQIIFLVFLYFNPEFIYIIPDIIGN